MLAGCTCNGLTLLFAPCSATAPLSWLIPVGCTPLLRQFQIGTLAVLMFDGAAVAGLVGTVESVLCFPSPVGIRVLSGFPSAASVSTRRPFLSFLLLFSFCLSPVFHRKTSRQERLRATIPNPVDLQHPPVCSLLMLEKTHGGSSRIHSCIRLSLELFRRPIAQRRM